MTMVTKKMAMRQPWERPYRRSSLLLLIQHQLPLT